MFKYVERDRLDDERAAKDAISAVYDTMHKRVARADNSALMKRINDIVRALFDLLKKDSLSREDIKALKASARKLLDAIRRSIADMDNWREKENTRAAVQSAIRNVLWNSLPQSYSDTEMTLYRQKVYTFVMDHYPVTRYAYS